MAALLTIWAAILVAGDTPAGRILRTMFVVRPAAWCDRIGRGHMVLFMLLLMIGAAAIWAGGADAARMIGMATPDIAIWATTFEVATYLDLVVTVTVMASAVRLRGVPSGLRDRAMRARRTARRRRRARAPRSPLPANDDGDGRRLVAA